MKTIPELGVGIIYFSGFRDIIESNFDLISLVEIEPQTFWIKSSEKLDSFIFNEEEIDYLQSLNVPTVFHGVGYPVAGSCELDSKHIPVLQDMIKRLDPKWMSEHLSFNDIVVNNENVNTNFLLPPLQTMEGIEVASRKIKKYSSYFDLPFAFETGVSYLQPRSFEVKDSDFIRSVADYSESYVLLDIHNLLANEKNGRQSTKEFINGIDLEKVIHIHVAGGFVYNGYYLDAHSGVSDEELFEVLERIVRRLPNLKGITFEMLPEYLTVVSKNEIRKQFERMNLIWDKRGIDKNQATLRAPITIENKSSVFTPTVADWEFTLGCLAINRQEWIKEATPLKAILLGDEGLKIIRTLIEKFRGSQLVSCMKLTCRYLMLKYGVDHLNGLFKDFWSSHSPLLFPVENALAFGEFLLENALRTTDEILHDLVLYEQNSLLTLLDHRERCISIRFDPNEVVALLSNRKLPDNIKRANYEIVIEPSDSIVGHSSHSSVFH